MTAKDNRSDSPVTYRDRADWGRVEWSMYADAIRNAYMNGEAPDDDEITRQINATDDDTDQNGDAQ